MSEEVESTNDGTWSGLKKTIVGVAGTVVTAGGVWVTTLFGGGDKEATPVQQAAPVINITNSNQQQQAAGGAGGKTVVIKEKETIKEKPAPVKKKDGDEFKEKPAEW
jgi:flagellar basal body-associated protein FliL